VAFSYGKENAVQAKRVLLAAFIVVVVLASLSAITLLTIWRDGSWSTSEYTVRANCVVGAGAIAAVVCLWKLMRH
jgi:hypothetical protein